jgi:ATP-dependent exoDNAse (exonuclease V) alpha subunit
MTKSIKILKTNHVAQSIWLDGQLRKNNLSIFLNAKIAVAAYEKLKSDNMGLISDSDLEEFIASRLSEIGIKKLITTLRVAESRSKNGFALQASITQANKRKLHYLSGKTGMKKNDVINKLIELADLRVLTKAEEQLEITL